MAQNGKNILITTTSGTSPFAATKSLEIQVDGELLEKASPNSGKWRESLAGRCGWSFTTGFLATRLADLIRVNESYNIKIFDATDITNCLQGTAILRSCRIDAVTGNLVTGSFQFVGNGPLEPPAPATVE
jgi:hypothetical protein